MTWSSIVGIAPDAGEVAENVSIPVAIALIGIAGTLLVTAITVASNRLSEAAERRRGGYSEAARELVAWAEYPYRIRRRTSDDSECLRSLAELGHQHQEALRYRQMWIRAESKWVATVFEAVLATVSAEVGPACAEAWASPPIETAQGMTLGPWGPTGAAKQIDRFQMAASSRFGKWRLVGWLGWRPAVDPQPTPSESET